MSLMFSFCEPLVVPDDFDYGSCAKWRIKNSTSEGIHCTFYLQNREPMDIKLNPSQESTFWTYKAEKKDPSIVLKFDDLRKTFKCDSVVFKTANRVLKTWVLKDADKPGKQFFNESSWKYHTIDSLYFWTFEFTPEDLVENQ